MGIMNGEYLNPYIGDPERIKMAKRFFIYLLFFLLLKTRTKKIIASSRRSRTVDSGEVISEVEAPNTM